MSDTLTPRTDSHILETLNDGLMGDYLARLNRLIPFARQLERELATEREQLAANHEATKLMGKWLEAERELADRLAGVLLSYDHDLLAGEDMCWLPEHDEALTAWKEARSE